MISLQQFSKEFLERHDFEYEDSNFLSHKYQHIKFLDIPEAWVFQIDDALGMLDRPMSVRSISQVMGLIVFDVQDLNDHDKLILKKLEEKIISLDKDLHDLLDVVIDGILLH